MRGWISRDPYWDVNSAPWIRTSQVILEVQPVLHVPLEQPLMVP